MGWGGGGGSLYVLISSYPFAAHKMDQSLSADVIAEASSNDAAHRHHKPPAKPVLRQPSVAAVFAKKMRRNDHANRLRLITHVSIVFMKRQGGRERGRCGEGWWDGGREILC